MTEPCTIVLAEQGDVNKENGKGEKTDEKTALGNSRLARGVERIESTVVSPI